MAKKVTKITSGDTVSISWREALKSFLFFKQAQGVSKTTIDDYKQHINRFFERFPDSWQSPILKDNVMEYMSDDIMPATFNLRLIYLKAFFTWSIKEHYMSENPLDGFKRRKAQPRIVDVPEEALQNILKLPNDNTFSGIRDYSQIMFTLDTGIRPKEALSLTIDDFDLKRGTVTVRADISKTRTERILPILPPTMDAVHKLIKVRPPSWGKDIPIFCSCEGTRLSRYSWRDRLEDYGKKLGTKIRPYDLRHAFALMYLRNGGHAFGLQKTLGHTDISMTKRYVNLSGDDLKDSHKVASPLNRLITSKKKECVTMVSV